MPTYVTNGKTVDVKLTDSDVLVLSKYFGKVGTTAEFSAELKRLSADEKAQLAEGIRTGTLTY